MYTLSTMLVSLEWSGQMDHRCADLVVEFFVLWMFPYENHEAASFDSHRCAYVLPRRSEAVWETLVFADYRQMTHYFDWKNVTGENHQSARDKNIFITNSKKKIIYHK